MLVKNKKTASKSLKKIATDYFSDCPELVKRIQEKKYKGKEILSVVGYYNNYCN